MSLFQTQPSDVSTQNFGFAAPATSFSPTTATAGGLSYTTWFIIVLVLAFLGINIFAYLAEGTQEITNVFSPIIRAVFGTAVATTGKVVDVSAEGAKAVVAGTAGALESGLNVVQDIGENAQHVRGGGGSASGPMSLQQALQQTTPQSQRSRAQSQYVPASAEDQPQRTGKSGWCFIGRDRGFRSCSQVGVNDVCMSGNIFPSQAICVNPSLRE